MTETNEKAKGLKDNEVGQSAVDPVVINADDYTKVGVRKGGTIHLHFKGDGKYTLCGRVWYFLNNHGATYCQQCQAILAKRRHL